MISTDKYLTPSKFLFRTGIMIFVVSIISWLAIVNFDSYHADKMSLALGLLAPALLAGANYCRRRSMNEIVANLPKSVFFWVGLLMLIAEVCMWIWIDRNMWILTYRKMQYFTALTATVSFQIADYIDPAGGPVKMRA